MAEHHDTIRNTAADLVDASDEEFSGFELVCVGCGEHLPPVQGLDDPAWTCDCEGKWWHHCNSAAPYPVARRDTLSHIGQLETIIRNINRANGWNVTTALDWERDKYKIPAVLALIHSEVSEALEAYRDGDRAGFEEECADIIIRVLDMTGGVTDDITRAIWRKLAINRRRGERHGGKRV